MNEATLQLQKLLGQRFHTDQLHQRLYATDASVYQVLPLGVAFPESAVEIAEIVKICAKSVKPIGIIPRAAGTSLAGQCVGEGFVVDVSRYMNKVIDFNPEGYEITVEPGINRNALNAFLAPHGMFFAPITSTANRATIGGMIGNNSCGTNSIKYGDSRTYVKSIKGILDDGSSIDIRPLNRAELDKKLLLDNREGEIYRSVVELLEDPELPIDLEKHFPKVSVSRRNTGYALDALYASYQALKNGGTFNLAPLIAGSEGTLLFMTAITIGLVPLPPTVDVIAVCPFATVQESMRAVTKVMEHQPYACELMDNIIMDCTRDNLKYAPILEHIPGNPAAVLLVEFRAGNIDIATSLAKKLITDLQEHQHGYGHSILSGAATKDIWALRSAGLGLLANIPGDKKGVACIEDTAVAIEDLADYMAEFAQLMERFEQKVVYYAHAGAGEIHLRPFLDLKQSKDRQLFYDITLEVAKLVKKYRGSLSGEHGDGRVRAPFLPLMVGEANYQRFERIKQIFDPTNVFNPGKIVDAAPMNEDLRYAADAPTPAFATVFDFSATQGMLRMAEKCNGSGDCRKLPLSGGTMCPSYQATRNEKDSTRGRANVLRQVLTENAHKNPFEHPDLQEVLDRCLSCKGCTSECPSNVDMSTLKAEVTHQNQLKNGVPIRARLFANINRINEFGRIAPWLTNGIMHNRISGALLKKAFGIAPQRSLPKLQKTSLKQHFKAFQPKAKGDKIVYLFCDEFTNHNDSPIGKKALELLDKLGYQVKMIEHEESGRAAISKGLLKLAKKHATANVECFAPLVSEDNPLLGIEPSAILSFRDEYPKLVDPKLRSKAKALAKNCLTVEEFLVREIKAFRITSTQFDQQARQIAVHGHCHQKALTDFQQLFTLLNLPDGHQLSLLDTGCCGMAGSFGYEAEHYELSMNIGKLRLFPAIEELDKDTIIVASGTSCRHQIMDGTGRKAVHAVEVLWEAVV